MREGKENKEPDEGKTGFNAWEQDDNEEDEDEDTAEVTVPLSTIASDLKGLLNSARFSDVRFRVGPAQVLVYAHKLLLASASPVLALMVYPAAGQTDSCSPLPAPSQAPSPAPPSPSPTTLCITIPDPLPVFLTMLEAVYTDAAPITAENVGACLRLGKKYCVEKLLVLCAEFLEQGVTVENVCAMFDSAPEVIGDPAFGLAFIASQARLVFYSAGFTALRPERLKRIIASSQIKLKEAAVFACCLEWGRAECARRGLRPEPASLREVLRDVIPLIRFPLFGLKQLATEVMSAGLLTPEESLELYTYAACKEAKTGEALPPTRFNAEPRLSLSFEFKFEKCGTNGTIRQGGTAVASVSAGYCCALGNQAMQPNTGKYYWECKVAVMEANHSADWQCGFGVATDTLNMNNYLSASTSGWCYYNQGCRCHNSGSSSDKFGGVFSSGAVIGVLLDSDEGTLSYFHNGKSLGQAFTDINAPVYPAVHVNTNVLVSLNRESPIPDEAY